MNYGSVLYNQDLQSQYHQLENLMDIRSKANQRISLYHNLFTDKELETLPDYKRLHITVEYCERDMKDILLSINRLHASYGVK